MAGRVGAPAVLAAIALAACAAPSRRLTPRVVEDPIVLPKGMASVAAEVRTTHYEPTNAGGTRGLAGIRFGLTNRLELHDLGLRFAILDDRPADGRTPMPFSLALQAGVRGIGYGSLEGMIVIPVASLSALKHVADRWALVLALDWIAQWLQHPIQTVPAYSGSLGYSSRIFSTLALRAVVTRQLAERTALGIAPRVEQTNDCIDPTCGWVSRGAGMELFVSQRPWDWLTLRVGPAAGVRERPDAVLPTMLPGGTPLTIPPTSVTWFAFSGTATFYW
jgi:hypothetical protein